MSKRRFASSSRKGLCRFHELVRAGIGMDYLNRATWVDEIALQMLGTHAVLRTDREDVAAGLHRLLEPFVEDSPAGYRDMSFALVDGDATDDAAWAGRRLLLQGAEIIANSMSWSAVVGALVSVLNRNAIEHYAGFAVHSGVVSSGGSAAALPAVSGGGKTTLTAACLRHGFDYVSDESLCVDMESDGITPYPKPLGLSRWSRRELGLDGSSLAFPPDSLEGMATAADLGGRVAEHPLQLHHIVLARFGSTPLSLTPAVGSAAMAALLELSFNHFKHGEGAFKLAAKLANSAQVWQLDYDDPLDAAELLRSELA